MSFELRDRDLLGRIGRLKTKSGVVETPAFMPVINPVNQVILPRRMKDEFGCEIVITNSYIIKKNYGDTPRLNVHELLDYDGVIATDSGAYQILVYGGVEVSQDEIIEYQKQLGSDIAVILDIPTGWDVPREEVEYTVEETLRRAEAALPLIEGHEALWVGPVQGGRHLDLVARSAKAVGGMPYHVHALGSPTEVMERYMFHVLVEMVMTAKLNLPSDRPLHLFGAGHPMMFALAVAMGCDLFDSAAYALYAKGMRYLTSRGTVRLQDLSYLPCSCPVCRSRDAQDLKDMIKGERVLNLAEHNLHATMAEIRVVKQAIVEGSLWDLVESRARGHASMTTALKTLGKYRRELEKGSPGFKGHGVFYYDYHSLIRPEVTRHIENLHANYEKPQEAETLLLVTAPPTSPYRTYPPYTQLRDALKERTADHHKIHTCFYAAPYGVVPSHLSETYPLSQFEVAHPLDHETIEFTAEQVAEYVKASGHSKATLYRGDGQLDGRVEAACHEVCAVLDIPLSVVHESSPWSEGAIRHLVDALNDCQDS